MVFFQIMGATTPRGIVFLLTSRSGLLVGSLTTHLFCRPYSSKPLSPHMQTLSSPHKVVSSFGHKTLASPQTVFHSGSTTMTTCNGGGHETVSPLPPHEPRPTNSSLLAIIPTVLRNAVTKTDVE